MKLKSHRPWRLALAGAWLVITLSLAAWWMIHGMRQAALLGAGGEVDRQQRMLFWEGGFFLCFLALGGGALAYFIYKDQRRFQDVRRFFSTFTHELKTSLTSLRLQAEILEEDPKNRENQTLSRLLRDVVRLELQLENALILAQAEEGKLILEDISLARTLQSLSVHWPHLKLHVSGDITLKADHRAIECIFRNLLQNASVHGQAKEVFVSQKSSAGQVEITLRDDGQGFKGDVGALGKMFTRHTTRSGSGLGLYLARILSQRMGGSLTLNHATPSGIEAKLVLGGQA